MIKFIYVVNGAFTKSAWVYEKNYNQTGYTVCEYKQGIETERSHNTKNDVFDTIASIIKDDDFSKIYGNSEIITMVCNIR